MIWLDEVEKIHDIIIQKFGGASGVRDKGGLASALARPHQTFDGVDLINRRLRKLLPSLKVLFLIMLLWMEIKEQRMY